MKAKKAEIGGVPENVFGMLGDLMSKLRSGAISSYHLAKFLKKQNPFVGEEMLIGWQYYYEKHFGIFPGFSKVEIPPMQKDHGCLIVVAKNVTANSAYKACADCFPCERWTDDLNKDISHNDRQPTKAYAVWIEDRKGFVNVSATGAQEQGILGITLIEYLLADLEYHDKTGKHLDENGTFTICSGSRCSGGGVPGVGWCGGRLDVHWCASRDAYSRWRVRTVVSF